MPKQSSKIGTVEQMTVEQMLETITLYGCAECYLCFPGGKLFVTVPDAEAALARLKASKATTSSEPSLAHLVSSNNIQGLVDLVMGKVTQQFIAAMRAETATKSIHALGLRTMALNALLRGDVETVADLIKLSADDLREFRQLGEAGLRAVRIALSRWGLKLRGD